MNKEHQEVEIIILDRDDDESLSELETLIESGFMTTKEVVRSYKLNEENDLK